MANGPYPSVANVLKVSFVHALGDTIDAMTHMYFPYSGTAPTEADLNTWATALAGYWLSYVMEYMTEHCFSTEINVKDLTSDTAAEGGWAGSNAGTGGTSYPAAGTALVMKTPIARRYRGGHPRMYFPGVDTSFYLNDATWDSTIISAFPTELGNFVAAAIGHPWSGGTISDPVNVSYFEGFTNVLYPSGRYHAVPKFREAGPITDAILGYVVNPKFGSQRRRNVQST